VTRACVYTTSKATRTTRCFLFPAAAHSFARHRAPVARSFFGASARSGRRSRRRACRRRSPPTRVRRSCLARFPSLLNNNNLFLLPLSSVLFPSLRPHSCHPPPQSRSFCCQIESVVAEERRRLVHDAREACAARNRSTVSCRFRCLCTRRGGSRDSYGQHAALRAGRSYPTIDQVARSSSVNGLLLLALPSVLESGALLIAITSLIPLSSPCTDASISLAVRRLDEASNPPRRWEDVRALRSRFCGVASSLRRPDTLSPIRSGLPVPSGCVTLPPTGSPRLNAAG